MKQRRLATDAFLALAQVAGTAVVIGAIESVIHVANISNRYVISVAILASRDRCIRPLNWSCRLTAGSAVMRHCRR